MNDIDTQSHNASCIRISTEFLQRAMGCEVTENQVHLFIKIMKDMNMDKYEIKRLDLTV